MLFPVCCKSCKRVFRDKYPRYRNLLADGVTKNDALTQLGMPAEPQYMCCRTHFLTHVEDQSDQHHQVQLARQRLTRIRIQKYQVLQQEEQARRRLAEQPSAPVAETPTIVAQPTLATANPAQPALFQ